MFQALQRRRDREDGFTLIELMVVVLIIAILVAIAIPTFLGARQRAQDRAAQSDLRNALTAAKTLFTDTESYASALTETALQGVEPSLDFAATGGEPVSGASQSVIGWAAPAASTVVFVKQSASGKYFCVSDNTAGPGTRFDSNTDVLAVDTVAECDQAAW